MQLHYHKSTRGNFGDDLNADFWEKLWPEYKSNDSADWLIGIGSIFTGKINSLPGRKMIMGAGYWPSDQGMPDLSSCIIKFVRGPLTCKDLSLDQKYAVSDPAILVRDIYPELPSPQQHISFIPHHSSAELFDCERLAKCAGLNLISPENTPEQVIKEIARSSWIISESMHGAIIADALGVPWQKCNIFADRISGLKTVQFKWTDWSMSVGIDNIPYTNCEMPYPGSTAFKMLIKKPFLDYHYTKTAKILKNISINGKYILSSRNILQEKINIIRDIINEVKSNLN